MLVFYVAKKVRKKNTLVILRHEETIYTKHNNSKINVKAHRTVWKFQSTDTKLTYYISINKWECLNKNIYVNCNPTFFKYENQESTDYKYVVNVYKKSLMAIPGND